MPLQERRNLQSTRIPPFLKQLQLLAWCVGKLRFVAKEQFNISKLLVGDAHDAHLPEFGQDGFHPLAMNLCILHAGTMAHINRKLEHGEAILNETLSEFGVFFDVLFRLCWEVEQH